VRRTKEEALATRESILDAAELVFEKQGVSRTTLQQIATAAGVTRGAIYWHFEDKGDLFNAMMDRTTMPLGTALQDEQESCDIDPLRELLDCLLKVFQLTATDPRARRVFGIATHKVEYVDEMTRARDRHINSYNKWLERSKNRLNIALRRGMLKTNVSIDVAALGLWAMTDGLIRTWLLNPEGFSLVNAGQKLLEDYLDSLRAPQASSSSL